MKISKSRILLFRAHIRAIYELFAIASAAAASIVQSAHFVVLFNKKSSVCQRPKTNENKYKNKRKMLCINQTKVYYWPWHIFCARLVVFLFLRVAFWLRNESIIALLWQIAQSKNDERRREKRYKIFVARTFRGGSPNLDRVPQTFKWVSY